MGRNREPIKLIQAKGKKHLTKQEINDRQESEVPVLNDKIKAPAFLTTKKERDEFTSIAQELMRLDIMSNLDCDVLGRYVKSSKDWEDYSKIVVKLRKRLTKALNYETETVVGLSELLLKYEGMKSKAFTQCHTCAKALGMTISDRCRIIVPKKTEEPKNNKFSEYIS